MRALGRAVWVDGLGRAPFPVGTEGDGGSSLSFVLGGYSSRLVDTQTYTHQARQHHSLINITHLSDSHADHVLGPSRMGRNLEQARARIIRGFRAHHIFLVVLSALRLMCLPHRRQSVLGIATQTSLGTLDHSENELQAALPRVLQRFRQGLSCIPLSDFTFTFHFDALEKEMAVFLPGESQGWGSLVGCRLWGHTESDTTEVT